MEQLTTLYPPQTTTASLHTPTYSRSVLQQDWDVLCPARRPCLPVVPAACKKLSFEARPIAMAMDSSPSVSVSQ